MSTFAVSGFIDEQIGKTIVPVRPASVVLVGGPGSGKTELVERFKRLYWTSYHNDLTVRPLLALLRKSEGGALTHVLAPEFNKFFQRKSSVWENCLGLLSSAMEEGITVYSVGPSSTQRFDPPARLGLMAGCTPGTMSKRRESLAEMGFLSRACVLEWALPRAERDEILRRMNHGDASDLEPIDLQVPESGRAVVQWNEALGERVTEYVKKHWPGNDLRTFKRFKVLMLARAYLVGHKKVGDDEWQWLQSYDDYWNRMVLGEE